MAFETRRNWHETPTILSVNAQISQRWGRKLCESQMQPVEDEYRTGLRQILLLRSCAPSK
jgi:hypothetical protein